MTRAKNLQKLLEKVKWIFFEKKRAFNKSKKAFPKKPSTKFTTEKFRRTKRCHPKKKKK
jgi:hypothetical protein